MSPICSSILFPILLALFCDALPAFDSKETSDEKLARFLDRYQEMKSDNLVVDLKGENLSDFLKEAWNRGEMKNKESPEELGLDYAVDKRAPSRAKYHYYKCYFNPVTCYKK